jgi:hypothetical protein
LGKGEKKALVEQKKDRRDIIELSREGLRMVKSERCFLKLKSDDYLTWHMRSIAIE